MKKLFAFTCVIFMSLTLTARAEVFLADSFSYSDGQLTDAPQDPPDNTIPGANVSGGNWTSHSGTGDTGIGEWIEVVGGQAELLVDGSEDVNRVLGTTMGVGDTWYYASTLTVNDTRLDLGFASDNEYFMHFWADNFGFRGRVYVDAPNDEESDTTFTFGLSSTSGGQFSKWATDMDFGTTHTVVVEYDYDSGDTRLWVDPTDINSPSISDFIADNTERNPNSPETAVSAVALRQGSNSNFASHQALVDEIAVGDDFAEVLAALGTDVGPGVVGDDVDLDDDGDVDGADFLAIQRDNPSLIPAWEAGYGLPPAGNATISAVPEPTSLVLFGLAAVMLPMVRRQRA